VSTRGSRRFHLADHVWTKPDRFGHNLKPERTVLARAGSMRVLVRCYEIKRATFIGTSSVSARRSDEYPVICGRAQQDGEGDPTEQSGEFNLSEKRRSKSRGSRT